MGSYMDDSKSVSGEGIWSGGYSELIQRKTDWIGDTIGSAMSNRYKGFTLTNSNAERGWYFQCFFHLRPTELCVAKLPAHIVV